MKTYPKILGYLGVLPFLLSLIGAMFFNGHPILGQMFLVFQLSYASMILSFLGGAHWPLALRDNNNIRLSLSMLPTIASLAMVLFGFMINPVYPLVMAGLLFIAVYLFDKYYAAQSDWTPEYMAFRLRITLIVSAILFITFGVTLS